MSEDREYQACFVVEAAEEGGFCAADMENGIFTEADSDKELLTNIREAVECHFDTVYEKVDVTIIWSQT